MDLYISIKKLLSILCLISFICACADKEYYPSNVKMSESPLYQNELFTTIEQRFIIDYDNIDEHLIRSITDVAVDSNMNLYVVDQREQKVHVFRNDGTFLRSMGTPGEGPSDLDHPQRLGIHSNRLIVYESFQGFKVWDLEGNYQDYIVRKGRGNNSPIFRPYDDFFFMHSYSFGQDREIRTWKFEKYSWKWDLLQTIDETEMNYMEEPNYYQYPLMPIDSGGNIYLPVSRDQYIINKYDSDGNLLLQFGRKFKRAPYSQWVRDWYSEEYKEEIKRHEMPLLPKYPPYIRYIMVDDVHDYIWVLVGEGFCDTFFNEIETVTLDIFDTDGTFLYTFKTDIMRTLPQIFKGQLYTRGLNREGKFYVYNINYMKR